MWRENQLIQQAPTNLFTEIIVRSFILIVVMIMHRNSKPLMRDITETEMLLYYNRPRKDSLIPNWTMVILVVCVPLSVIFLHCRLYDDNRTQALLSWTLAITVTAIFTETFKLVSGRPRPDYLYRCFPDGEVKQDLECTGDKKEVINGRKSFPSGHSSFSFCSLGFTSIYLFGALGVFSRNRGQGLRVITCLLPLLVASAVAMSRYCDNHHHWEDVVIGSIIGLSSSYFCYRQYYHPLDSEHSGVPYQTAVVSTPFNPLQEECSTSQLPHLPAAPASLENNKKK